MSCLYIGHLWEVDCVAISEERGGSAIYLWVCRTGQDRAGAHYRGGPRWLDWTRHTRLERLLLWCPSLPHSVAALDVNRVQSSQLAHSRFSRSDEPGSPSLQHKAVRTEGPRPVSLPPYPSDRCRIIRESRPTDGGRPARARPQLLRRRRPRWVRGRACHPAPAPAPAPHGRLLLP